MAGIAIQECVVDGELIGNRHDAQESAFQLFDRSPEPTAILLLDFAAGIARGLSTRSIVWRRSANEFQPVNQHLPPVKVAS